MPKVVMLLGNIFPVNGGLTHAVYRRANALVEAGMKVVIFTFHYHHDFDGVLRQHVSEGTIDPRVEVLNLYEAGATEHVTAKADVTADGFTAFPDARKPFAQRVFNERGEYVAYESRDEQGVLQFIDRFETPWVRVAKEIYDAEGRLRRVLHMDKLSNKPDFSVLYNSNGRPQVSSKLVGGKARSFFSHFDQREYSTELEMVVEWMQRCLAGEEALVVLSEKREMIVPLLKVGGDRARHVLCLHSSHLEAPYDDRTAVSPSMNPALEGLRSGAIDQIVILTEAQADDMRSLVGSSHSVSHIPHFQAEATPETVQRHPRRIVSLARYHHVKNLPEAFQVVGLIRQHVPDVVYDVYGYGEEKANLQAMVVDLGLEENVFLHDHASDTEQILKGARLMLMTSKQEGQPLSQLESLAAGTPVVSYDTPYGARENIRHGVDGFVVTYGEGRIQEAAQAALRLLNDDGLFDSFSKAAKEVTRRFSQARFEAEWASLVQSLTAKGEVASS